MTVVEEGRITGGRKLRSHDPMPVRYELRRSRYVLNASIDQSYGRPAMNFTALTIDGEELLINGIYDRECYGVLLPGEGQLTPLPPRAPQLTFVWTPISLPKCPRPRRQEVGEGEMAFNIFNEQDEQLGSEIIQFSIQKNGYFIEIDSI